MTSERPSTHVRRRWNRLSPRATVVAVVLALSAAGCGIIASLSWGQFRETPGPSWHLVFADEFDGHALDHRKWSTCYWWADGGCTNGHSGEEQWYLPHQVTVSGGELHLTAERRTVHGPPGRRYPYTSGMVTTGRTGTLRGAGPRFAFTYGRAVARMRMPAGQGLWSAFWLLPASQRSRPELDVVEVLGHAPQRMHAHYHYLQGGRPRDPGHEWAGQDVSAGWHDYAVDWSPSRIVWTVDGREVWRFTDRAVISHEPMYLLLNLAVGGDWPGNPSSSTPFPSSVDVDYVRVWQKGA